MKKQINYRMTSEVIGEGSMGVVYRAVDLESDEHVAAKLVQKRSLTQEQLRSLRAEAAMHTLAASGGTDQAKHVVRPLAIAETDDYVYLFMELVVGHDLVDELDRQPLRRGLPPSLKRRRRRRRRLPAFAESRALELFRQALDAVEHCHKRGVVHRDIKLENFIMDRQTNKLKLTDFGLADTLFEDDDGTLVERPLNKWCGSPAYAAPELCARKPDYAGRPVDVWSLGVTLYTMLCGYFPFRGDIDDASNLSLFDSIMYGELEFDAKLKLSADVQTLLRGMLDKEPAKRLSIEQIRSSPWLQPPQQQQQQSDKSFASLLRSTLSI